MSKKIAAVATTKPVATSNTLTFRRTHPKDRVSYGIPGVRGLAVIDLSLFADGKAPKTITLDCLLAVAAPVEAKKPEPAKNGKADAAAK